METLKEFRPQHKNVVHSKRVKKSKAKKSKKGSSSIFSATNIALLACAVMLGFGQFKKNAQIESLSQANLELGSEIDKLKMERMKYMADKKIQDIAKQTLGHKVAHVNSLKAIIEKSKSDLAAVTTELENLKKVKMSALEYKQKLAAMEKNYQQRLDAHNRASTDTINRMGRKMMAEVDKVKTVEAPTSSRHTVKFGSTPVAPVQKNFNRVPASKNEADRESSIGDWKAGGLEL